MQHAINHRLGQAPGGRADHPAWLIGLAGLLLWQGWMTLQFFGVQGWPDPLLNNKPILSGRHPLHLYHGYLGSRTLFLRGSLCCYDPAFDAGYPKTPVFDGGARPAELVLALAGGHYIPTAYKLGLALFCLAVPWLLWIGARSLQMERGAAFLAGLLAVLLWWSPPVRTMLEAGNIDQLLAGVMLMLHAALLIRYHNTPDLSTLGGLFVSCVLGWCASPLFQVLLLPLFLGYYLRVGPRHNLLWHGLLIGVWLAAVGVNLFWLLDWLDYWWLLVANGADNLPALVEPSGPGTGLLARWVGRGLAALLLAAAVFGLSLWRSQGQRPAAKIFGTGLTLLLVLSVLGRTWDPLIRLGAASLLVPAFLMAIPAAASGLWALVRGLESRLGVAGMAWLGVAALVAWFVLIPHQLAGWSYASETEESLQIGLRQEQQDLVTDLVRLTTPDARILWEDQQQTPVSSHWSALLPLLTGRSFVGGLDCQAKIEHATCGLYDLTLAGRPLSDWNDGQLLEYCQRYNIGWILARSPSVVARLANWPVADLVRGRPEMPGSLCLYQLKRSFNFALVGSARWLQADPMRVVLGDVTPYQDRVVLSLHYQAGMRVTPGRIKIEPAEYDSIETSDAIPFVRLKLTEPASRVTITWEKR